jgi:phage FluMu gp28-like protein
LRGGAHDATGNGGYLAEVMAQEFGPLRIAQIKLSASWYIEHMPRMKAHFEDQTVTTPKDADIFADLRSIRKVRGVPKVDDSARQTGTDGKPRHGDSAIALVLGMYAVEHLDAGEIDFIEVPRHPRGFDNNTDDRLHSDIVVPEQRGW